MPHPRRATVHYNAHMQIFCLLVHTSACMHASADVSTHIVFDSCVSARARHFPPPPCELRDRVARVIRRVFFWLVVARFMRMQFLKESYRNRKKDGKMCMHSSLYVTQQGSERYCFFLLVVGFGFIQLTLDCLVWHGSLTCF